MFTDWSGDLTSTAATEQIIMNSDKTITANFTAVNYPINITVTGGTATVTTLPTDEAPADETVTVYISGIETDKIFKSITVKDGNEQIINTIEVTEGEEYTFIMPAKSVTITVELVDKIKIFTITFIVKDIDGIAVNGATIKINNTIRITNASGSASIDLENGEYPYTVIREGYEEVAGTVVVNNEDETVNVILTIIGITETKNSEIKLYPNPAINSITLEKPQKSSSLVEIYTVSGQIVKSVEWNDKSIDIDISDLMSGVLFMKIKTNRVVEIFKVIKQ